MRKDWILTDSDSVQYCREVYELETNDKVFELYQIQQVQELPDNFEDDFEENAKIYRIAHDIIFSSEIDTESILDCYDYESLAEVREIYGDAADQILAECQFELDAGCFQNIMLNMPLMTYIGAKETIEKIIEEK